MADFARFLFRVPRTKMIGSIEVDAFISENHNYQSTISRYPIEEGGNISDNIVNEPPTVTVQGIVGAATSLLALTGVNRTLDAFNAFIELHESKELVTLVTGLKVYENMHLQEFRVPRNARNGATLTFNATLKQANVVASQFEVIPNTQLGGDEATQKQAQAEVDVSQASSGQTQQSQDEDYLGQVQIKVDEAFDFFEGEG